MKLGIITLLVLGLLACDGVNDGSNMLYCVQACIKGNRTMLRWAPKEGCTCSAEAPSSSVPLPSKPYAE